MSLAEEYRRRAMEEEEIAAQSGSRKGQRWLGLARSWRELADRLESEEIDHVDRGAFDRRQREGDGQKPPADAATVTGSPTRPVARR